MNIIALVVGVLVSGGMGFWLGAAPLELAALVVGGLLAARVASTGRGERVYWLAVLATVALLVGASLLGGLPRWLVLLPTVVALATFLARLLMRLTGTPAPARA